MIAEPGRVVAEDLGRHFSIRSGGDRSLQATLLRREATKPVEFWALRHVDFDIAPGETFGIIGRNGSGKSTLLKIIARIFGPSEGRCLVGGRVSSLLELGAGFHPEFTARENIFLSAAVYGIPRAEVAEGLDEIIAFAELEQFADQPIKTFSSGMFVRLGFSVAMYVQPDVLLLDEALSVGDEKFVQKCLRRIEQFRGEGGTMLLVTHDAGTVRQICDRALLLDGGTAVSVGPARDIVNEYHQRLARREAPEESPTEPGDRAATEIPQYVEARMRLFRPNGDEADRFAENEAFSVEVELRADRAVRDGVIRLAFSDEAGYELGVRFLRNVELDPDQTARFELHGVHGPLREGLFKAEALILDGSSGLPIAGEAPVERFEIASHDAEHWGPVRIEGTWESPARPEQD